MYHVTVRPSGSFLLPSYVHHPAGKWKGCFRRGILMWMSVCCSQAGWLLRLLGGLQGVEGVAPCGRPRSFRDTGRRVISPCTARWSLVRRGVPCARVWGKSRIETQQIGTVIGRQRRWRFRKPPPQVFYTQRFPQTFDALTKKSCSTAAGSVG